MAQHTAKRAEVVKQKAELGAKSAPINPKSNKPGPVSKGQVKFVEDTAKETGGTIPSTSLSDGRLPGRYPTSHVY